MKRTVLFTLLLALLGSLTLRAQDSDLEKTLQSLSGSAAKSYVGPVINGFGTNFNGGWFHGAPPAKVFGIDLQFGVVAMGTPFKDENKSFSTSGTFRFNQDQAGHLVDNANLSSIPVAARPAARQALIDKITSTDYTVILSGPTVLGAQYDPAVPGSQVKVKFPGDNITVNGVTIPVPSAEQGLGIGGVPGLDGLSMLPLGAPQLSIGTVYGTQATFRYLPKLNVDGTGSIKYFGYGIQHNIAMWLPVLPVDISASFFKQKLTVDPYMEATGTAYGLTVSKCFSAAGLVAATPYIGFMKEKSNMKFTYNATGTFNVNGLTVHQLPVEFSADGENTSRFTVGASFKLLFLNINADYNIGKYNSFTGGLMFII